MSNVPIIPHIQKEKPITNLDIENLLKSGSIAKCHKEKGDFTSTTIAQEK